MKTIALLILAALGFALLVRRMEAEAEGAVTAAGRFC